jgi:O-antigen/teichoic acid export membrane protein
VINRLPAARSPSWVIAETATAAVFSFFSLMAIARVIGPDAAGLGAVAIAAFLLVDLACASLFTDSLVQRATLLEQHVRSALTVQVLVGVAGAVLLALLAPGIAYLSEAPEVSELILVLAALLPFSAFSGALAGLVLRAQRFRLLALRALLGQPLALVAGLLVAAGGHGAWAMIAQQAVGTAVTFALMLAFGRHRLRPGFTRPALADLWPVAGPQILAVIVLVGRYRLFVLALGALTTEAVVAVCNVAFRLLDSALSIVWGSVQRLSVPRLSAQQANRAAMADIYGHLAQLQALMGMPIAAGIALTAHDLIRAVLGPAWIEAAEATRLVGWVAVLSFCWGDPGSLFLALGKTKRNLLLSTVMLAVPVAALLVARPATPVGVAVCWASSTIVIAPFLIWLVLRELKRSPLWLLGRIAPALIATAAMAVAVMLLQRTIARDLPPVAHLVASAAVGVCVFSGVAWLALGRRSPRGIWNPGPVAAAE